MQTMPAQLRRCHRTPWPALCALVIAASILCASARASACIVAQSGPFLEVLAQQVPANGVLIVGYYCYSDCGTGELPTELVIVDDTDATRVPGSVVTPPVDASLPDLILWRPDDGFREGHAYRIDSAQDAVFWAVTAMAIDASAVELASDCALEERSFGDELCCAGICDTKPCMSPAVRRVPACHVDWWTREGGASSQYLGRVTWSSADEPGAAGEWQWGYASHDFSAQAEQYCYELELVSLIDGSSKVLPKSCLPHGSLGQVGVFVKSRTDFVDEVTNNCLEAPSDIADVWCAGVDAACTEGDPNACTAHNSECSGGAGQGGQGSAGQANATAGQAAGGQNAGGQNAAGQGQLPAQAAGADGTEALDLAQDSGCSCSVPGAGGSRFRVPMIAMMTLAGIWGRWRRARYRVWMRQPRARRRMTPQSSASAAQPERLRSCAPAMRQPQPFDSFPEECALPPDVPAPAVPVLLPPTGDAPLSPVVEAPPVPPVPFSLPPVALLAVAPARASLPAALSAPASSIISARRTTSCGSNSAGDGFG